MAQSSLLLAGTITSNISFSVSRNNRDRNASPLPPKTWKMTSESTCRNQCRISWPMSSKRIRRKSDENLEDPLKASLLILSKRPRILLRRRKKRANAKISPRAVRQVSWLLASIWRLAYLKMSFSDFDQNQPLGTSELSKFQGCCLLANLFFFQVTENSPKI